jgi:transposase-like protein
MNSKRMAREQWARMVELQEKSGQSVRVFCQERGLGEASFYSWRKRLRKEMSVSFALVEPKTTMKDGFIELVLSCGDRLRIPTEAAILRMVLSIVRERP